MAETVYYAAMSLDGFIAEPEEQLTWLMGFDGPPYEGPDAQPMEGSYDDFYAGVGALAMGAKTYDFLLAKEIWPYGSIPTWIYTHRDLPRVKGADGIRRASGDVADEHPGMLAAAGDKDLWLMGGGELASQFADAGLLDRLQLTVVATILGAGLPLFSGPVPPMRLTGTTSWDTGMVELRYALS